LLRKINESFFRLAISSEEWAPSPVALRVCPLLSKQTGIIYRDLRDRLAIPWYLPELRRAERHRLTDTGMEAATSESR
jgi:hypothetical protein